MRKLRKGLLVAGLMLSASTAQAGNDDGILLGNDAALTAGAVVATVNDGSALWYNPAGLAHAAASSVDVGATAFALRRYKLPRLIALDSGEQADASFTEIVSIPSALTYVRRFNPRVVGGLGLFASQISDYTLRASMSLPLAPADARVQLLFTQEVARYHIAAGVGAALPKGFSVGVSLLGDYQDAVGVIQSSLTADLGGQALAAAITSTHSQEKVLGFHARFGATYVPAPFLRFGFSLESPAAYFFRGVRVTGVDTSTEPNATATGFDLEVARADVNKTFVELGKYLPLRARFGGAFVFGDATVSLEGDVTSRLRNSDVEVDRKLNWNLRAGGRFRASEHVHVGAGLFTDRGAEREDRQGTGTIDFYGATLGGQYDTIKWLAGSGNPQEPRANLTFSSTLAVRYAYGTGKVLGQYLSSPDYTSMGRAIDMTVHEFTVHLGSGIYF